MGLGRAMMGVALAPISIRTHRFFAFMFTDIRLTLREKTSCQYSNSRKEECTCRKVFKNKIKVLYEETRKFPSKWWLTRANLCMTRNYTFIKENRSALRTCVAYGLFLLHELQKLVGNTRYNGIFLKNYCQNEENQVNRFLFAHLSYLNHQWRFVHTTWRTRTLKEASSASIDLHILHWATLPCERLFT